MVGRAGSLDTMLRGLESAGMTLANKLRLIAIFIIAQEGVTEEVRRQLVTAAGQSCLTPIQSIDVGDGVRPFPSRVD